MEVNSPVAAEGLQRFEIEIGGETHEISFTISEDMTQRQFQQAMADAINSANIGISASVTTSGTASTLALEAAAAGAGADGLPRFSIRDLEGEAATLTGAGEVFREGQDALFSVNGGGQQSSASNDVDLGGGLLVTLLNTAEEGVAVTLGRSGPQMRNAVRQVVTRFNELLEAAWGNNADRVTRLLVRDLQGAARVSRRGLEEIGISIAEGGRLTIDENRLNAASENGRLERFFAGGDGRQPNSFIGRLSRISDNVIRNPMRHVSPHASRLPGFNAVLNALNDSGGTQGQGNGASPFDAYLPDDLMSFLFDAMR
jgi:flagellar capping protein FliD